MKRITILLAMILAIGCGSDDGESKTETPETQSTPETTAVQVPSLDACESILLASCTRLKECGFVLAEDETSIYCIDSCDAFVDETRDGCKTSADTYDKPDVDACVGELIGTSCGVVCSDSGSTSACDGIDVFKPTEDTSDEPTVCIDDCR